MSFGFTIKDMFNAGMHYGHLSKYNHPKMSPYIYLENNNSAVLDLNQSYALLNKALSFVQNIGEKNGKILFVGTKKRQAAFIVEKAANLCQQYYVNNRWLGGMLTNWKTIYTSIRMLKNLEDTLKRDSGIKYTKKEYLLMLKKHRKLSMNLGGICDMNGLPDALFVVDVRLESVAVAEARTLGIPIIGMADSNASPEGIDYLIPSNDDSRKSIAFCAYHIAKAFNRGLHGEQEIEQDTEQEIAQNVVEQEVTKVIDQANFASNTHDIQEQNNEASASSITENTDNSDLSDEKDQQSASKISDNATVSNTSNDCDNA